MQVLIDMVDSMHSSKSHLCFRTKSLHHLLAIVTIKTHILRGYNIKRGVYSDKYYGIWCVLGLGEHLLAETKVNDGPYEPKLDGIALLCCNRVFNLYFYFDQIINNAAFEVST